MVIKFLKSLANKRINDPFTADDLIKKQNDEFRKIDKMCQNVAMMGMCSVRLHIPQKIKGKFLKGGFHFDEYRSIHNVAWNNLFMHNNGAVIVSAEASALGIDVLKLVFIRIQGAKKFDNQHHSSGKITHNKIKFYWAIDRYDLKHGKGFIKPTETDFMDNENTLVMRVYI